MIDCVVVGNGLFCWYVVVVSWFGLVFVVVRSVRTKRMKQAFCTLYFYVIVAYVVDLSIT